MKFTYFMGTSFTKLRLFFHKVSITNTLFTPSRETLYAGRVKLITEASELFAHAVFRLVVFRKTASSKCILQGAKRMEVGSGGGGAAKTGLVGG
jgi:hypothetical protein